jgi:hypothetical protein
VPPILLEERCYGDVESGEERNHCISLSVRGGRCVQYFADRFDGGGRGRSAIYGAGLF